MSRTRSVALAAAVLLPVAACALLGLVRGVVANNNAALVLVLVVVAVAATGYRAAGLVAAVVSAASFDFFLTQPYLQFAITERDDVEAAVLLALIGRQIVDVLDLDACRFDASPQADPARPRLHVDGSVAWRRRVVDVEREGLPTLDAIELSVNSAGVDRGRFLLVSTTAVRRPDRERRLVAVALADQAAAALGSRTQNY
jgi:hypothetical protein